jgi:hypothetical protein
MVDMKQQKFTAKEGCEMMGMKGRCGLRTKLVYEGMYLCGSCFGHMITVQAQRAEKVRAEMIGVTV